jgi:hypothetical protein
MNSSKASSPGSGAGLPRPWWPHTKIAVAWLGNSSVSDRQKTQAGSKFVARFNPSVGRTAPWHRDAASNIRRPLKRDWRKKRLNSRKQLKNTLPEARPENCSCGAPDRPKRHPTSTAGFDLPACSRPRHWRIWFPIRRSKAHPSVLDWQGDRKCKTVRPLLRSSGAMRLKRQ